MHLSKTTGALTVAAALALPSAAFAQTEQPAPEQGKATAPGQLCKGESKKKTEGQKKSDFAVCVTGAKKVQAKAERTSVKKATKTAPGQFCKSFSKKKLEGQDKSDFATCVTGAAKAQKDLRKQAREARKAEREAQKAEKAEQTEQTETTTQS